MGTDKEYGSELTISELVLVLVVNQYPDFSSRACNLYIIILLCPVKQKTENCPKTRIFSRSVWVRWPSLTHHLCQHRLHWLGPEEQPGFL